MKSESAAQSALALAWMLVATVALLVVIPLAVYPYSEWLDGQVASWEMETADRHLGAYREAREMVTTIGDNK